MVEGIEEVACGEFLDIVGAHAMLFLMRVVSEVYIEGFVAFYL